MKRTSLVTATVLGLMASTSFADDFKPPADGKLTEKQLLAHVEVKRDQMKAVKDADAAGKGVAGDAAKTAIFVRMSQKMAAAPAAHGLSDAENAWIESVVAKTWMVALYQDQWETKGKPELEQSLIAKTAEREAAVKKLAAVDDARKAGVRFMSPEEKDAAVKAATTDKESAAGELKEAEAAVKQVSDEVATHEKDCAAAEALAKTPPADIGPDDKAGYIDGKKNEAQAASDAAKESRTKLAEAQKAVTDAKAKIAACDTRVAHPEKPVTDDDKADIKGKNDAAYDEAKAAVDGADAAIAATKDTLAAGSPVLTQLMSDPKNRPDPDNLALVRKHLKEYLTAIGAEKMLDGK